MSQSTTKPVKNRAVLFQRDGELAEFAELLSELEIPIELRNGALATPEELEDARLVVVCGSRLLESGTPNLSHWPRTIAVVDGSSRTLVSHLTRIGAAIVIRRPIHMHTLRLLLLHEVYRGPERRIRKRILIGHPVRISCGLRRPHATLLELSAGGARIELSNPPKIGNKIRLILGKDLTKGKSLKLRAKIVRTIRPTGNADPLEAEVGISFFDADRHSTTIKSILDRFAIGPASWSAGSAAAARPPSIHSSSTAMPAKPAAETNRPAIPDPLDSLSSERTLPRSHTLSAEPIAPCGREDAASLSGLSGLSGAESSLAETESSDRRNAKRVPYERRIVALGEEAARVLVGRDLSLGGMRIAATDSISVGDQLRVALHCGSQSEPIVVIAHALRDDGDDGLVLTFQDLSQSHLDQLEKIIASGLPVHASPDDTLHPLSASESVVLAEMLETLPRRVPDDLQTQS